MINHTNQNHTISLPDNTIEILGNNVSLVNPKSIASLLAALVENTPLQHKNVPDFPFFINIVSDTLPSDYAVVNTRSFEKFTSTLKKAIDLITLNEIITQKPINSYSFTI
jgi:hypothetical protein